jgi:hypothetical protein
MSKPNDVRNHSCTLTTTGRCVEGLVVTFCTAVDVRLPFAL